MSRFYKLNEFTVVDTETTATMMGNADAILKILEGLELEVEVEMAEEIQEEKLFTEVQNLMISSLGVVGLLPCGRSIGGRIELVSWKTVVEEGYLPSMKPYMD